MTTIFGNYLETKTLYNIMQHGFRNKYACLSQLFDNIHRRMESIIERNNVNVVYLDFAKAFDKVDHKILFNKFFRLGVSGLLYKWIKCFLTNRKQPVYIEGRQLHFFDMKSGVPQGSVFAPLLFNIFISDIHRHLNFIVASFFPDNTRIYKSK